MEQGAIADELSDVSNNFTKVQWWGGPRGDMSLIPLDCYVCPSDYGAPMNEWRDTGSWGQKPVNSYVGIIGSNKCADLPNNANDAKNTKFNGMLWHNTEHGFKDMTDGSSNTILIGERANVEPWRGAVWCGINRCRWQNGLLGGLSKDPAWTLNGTQRWNALGSLHPGGGNFLRGDASVHFVSETINGDAYEAFGTRAGREVSGL